MCAKNEFIKAVEGADVVVGIAKGEDATVVVYGKTSEVLAGFCCIVHALHHQAKIPVERIIHNVAVALTTTDAEVDEI